ncbi:unnamed protein product [Mytilus edulis]|uniref:Integrase catalytic domain-containing protein n=1 Tax=Mytilus edulis TaxID=6550 RepID=A0A8S3RBY4_MYTED|nr:unnamed protein product [Mytilus edulis]
MSHQRVLLKTTKELVLSEHSVTSRHVLQNMTLLSDSSSVSETGIAFGSPLQLHSDQGRSFEAKLFQDLCDLLKIDKTRSNGQHPQSNGSVERFNRTLLSMLTFYCQNDQRNWDEILPQVMMAYRSSVHASTGQTPNMMMFGRNIFLPMEAVIPRPEGPNESTSPETDKCVNELQDAMSITSRSSCMAL